MTGSTRLSSTFALTTRGPYSGPPTAVHSNRVSEISGRELASVARTRLYPPFVPPGSRMMLRADVTNSPVVEQDAQSSDVEEIADVAAPIAELFSDDAAPATDFASFIESQYLHEDDTGASAELPWIEAFVAEPLEPEETWPIDEAGQRLTELTQSLSSLDAARERLEAERLGVGAVPAATPDAALPSWSGEEWIDIMPTAPATRATFDDMKTEMPGGEVHEAEPTVVEKSAVPDNVESAARALEGLAQRVRAGAVQVPALTSELSQEAVLAGLLASMLGWRH